MGVRARLQAVLPRIDPVRLRVEAHATKLGAPDPSRDESDARLRRGPVAILEPIPPRIGGCVDDDKVVCETLPLDGAENLHFGGHGTSVERRTPKQAAARF